MLDYGRIAAVLFSSSIIRTVRNHRRLVRLKSREISIILAAAFPRERMMGARGIAPRIVRVSRSRPWGGLTSFRKFLLRSRGSFLPPRRGARRS